ENFFRFKLFSDKPFNLFTENDVSAYIEVMIDNDFSMNRINMLVSNLASFRLFLIERHSNFFSQYFLNNINELKLGRPEKKYSESQSLNYQQLELVKKFILNNERTEYIFQILYQLGIDKKDFEVCTPENAIPEKQIF